MYENAPKIYEQRVVAFVDILGWSEACKTESSRLIAATHAIHEAAQTYSSAMKSEMIKTPNFTINPIYLNYQFGAFSDSFAVSMPAHSGYRIISGVAEVCRSLLGLGFLTHGGITVGDLHHIDNVVFGPALIEAVQLKGKQCIHV